MTHEFVTIVQNAQQNERGGLKNVLATVVALDGSSYRKPGVRMLIAENGMMTGAVSGGCVEKEVLRRAQTVFNDGKPKIIAYDGRYRLGCEGIIYMLLEPFSPSAEMITGLFSVLKKRQRFGIQSIFEKEDEFYGDFGSIIQFENGEKYPFSTDFQPKNTDFHSVFEQTMKPLFKLIIIGGEHDSVKLCTMAALLGWDVEVITSLKDPKQLQDFPGAAKVIAASPETIEIDGFDAQTAVVLMTHNYTIDLKYLLRLHQKDLGYLALLGSSKRKDQLQNDLFEYAPELSLDFLERIYSPAGLDIGAITPEEIALSILSEILAVTREKDLNSIQADYKKIK